MAHISFVSIKRHRKEMNYEQCVNLLLLIMELFEKKWKYMHLVSANTRSSPSCIFSEFRKIYTEVCLNIILNISTNYFTKYTACKY